MKKINAVRVLSVVVFSLACVVLPSIKTFAADNESVLLPKYVISQITTNGAGTTYVSDPNLTSDFVTLDIPNITIPSTDSHGDAAYSMSYMDGHLFVAAGKKDDSTSTGGMEIFDSANNSLDGYGANGTTYRQVYARNDNTIFLAYFDTSYKPQFEAVNYTGSSIVGLSSVALTPADSAADITALSVSGDKAFVGIQDDGSGTDGGYVNVIDISHPDQLDSTTPGVYATSDTVTSVAGNGSVFYVGHGNDIDVVDSSTLVQVGSSINTGAKVNGLVTDGTYLYVANDTNGLRVYNVSDLSLVGEYTAPAENATAVAVDGDYIYFAMSNGTDSEIFKVKMVAITLNPDLPFTELGHAYVDPGATASDGSTVTSDANTAVDVNTVGFYTVTYTTPSSFLKMTREVEVRDTTPPVITLVAPNPQTVKINTPYVELGANTDDGSQVQIDASAVNTNALGSYAVTYDSVDASQNHSVQVVRTVNVVTDAYTVTATAGFNGSITPAGAVVVEKGKNQIFDITPFSGYAIQDVLVDGNSVGAINSYTFTNVLTDHTIDASFRTLNTYTITASANPHGSISPSGAVSVTEGNDQTFTVTPDSGAHIADVTVDGVSVGKVSTYTFSDVAANHTIRANFGNNITSGGSVGGGSNSSGPTEDPGCGGRTTGYSATTGKSCAPAGQVLGAEKFVFTLFLKMGHSPYPTGAYANEVMELQKFLNADPYNSGLVVDGKFGPKTRAAVIKFQSANGLVGDGLVGPLTRAVLNK